MGKFDFNRPQRKTPTRLFIEKRRVSPTKPPTSMVILHSLFRVDKSTFVRTRMKIKINIDEKFVSPIVFGAIWKLTKCPFFAHAAN